MSTLFISHSSSDNAAATALKERLEEQGHHSLFLDLDPEKGIQTGTSWERTLYTKLRACRAVVALCSDRYLASQWCFAEIALARMEGKEMFVLQIDPWSEQTRMPSILTEEQFIDLRNNPDDGYERLWNGFKVKGIVPEEHREWRPEEPPYPGLRAFNERDAPIFFGRDNEVREGIELLNRVRRHGHPRMVMVLGSSGSGKSSLTRAGILPQLRRDVDSWRIVGPFRPGRQPHRELAAALSRAFEDVGRALSWEEIHARLGPPTTGSGEADTAPPPRVSARDRLRQALREVERELSEEDTQVAETVSRLKDLLGSSPARAPDEGPAPAPADGDNPLAELASELRLAGGGGDVSVVMIIDQFEELLGHDSKGPAHAANHFLQLLRDALKARDDPPLALGTMRSDFLGVLQRSAYLPGVKFKSLSVGPMPREGMKQVIERPAVLGRLVLKGDLTDRLLEETGTADALPLLAFTLRAMWDRYHEDNELDVRDYEELGGLQGAIALVAEETTEAALKLGEETDLRKAFLRLARPAAEGTGWTRQPASWVDLPENVRPMLQHFVDQRLLVKRADGTVEVAHEALFRSWGKLRGWLDKNSEALHLRGEIRLDAEKWEKEVSPENRASFLLRAVRLARAIELRDSGLLPLGKLEEAFIEDSQRAHLARIEAKEEAARQELRRAKKRFYAAAVALVLVVGLGIWALFERSNAIKQEREATARKLSFASRNQLGVDNQLALLLSVEGARIRPLPEFDELLRKGIAERGRVLAIFRHSERVRYVLWHPQGEPRAISISGDSKEPVALFDTENRQRVTTCEDTRPGTSAKFGYGQDIAAWSPDGKRLLTGGIWGGAALWSVEDDRCDFKAEVLPRVSGDTGDHLYGAAWHPQDSTRFVTAQGGGRAAVWRVEGDGEVRLDARLEGHATGPNKDPNKIVWHASWSPDGRRIATASGDGTARVWSGPGFRPVRVLRGHEGAVTRAAWSPDGSRVLTAGDDKTARVWRVDGNGAPVVLEGHNDKLTAAAWSPDADGNSVLTASKDQTARLWDPEEGEQRAILTGHSGQLITAAWSESGTRIVTAGADGTARVWDASGEQLAVLTGHAGLLKWAVWSPDSRYLFTSSTDKTARLWDPEDSGPIPVLDHGAEVVLAAWSSDDARILTAGADGTARLWSSETGELQERLDHGGKLTAAAWSPNDRQIVTASSDGTARVWDAESGDEQHALEDHQDKINHASWSPTGSWIATASEDKTARVWDADSGQELFQLRHETRVVHASWSEADSRLVTTTFVGTSLVDAVRVWTLSDAPAGSVLPGSAFRSLGGVHGVERKGSVWKAVWSPDDTRILTAGNDFIAGVFSGDADDDAKPLSLEHTKPVQDVAWSSTGTRLATACDDNTARLWDAETGRLVEPLEGHGAPVHHVSWSPPPQVDRFVLTASDDTTARIWVAKNGAEKARLGPHAGRVNSAAWNSDGSRVVTASNDGTARIHYVEMAELIAAACSRIIRPMDQDEWQQYMGAGPPRETCPTPAESG